MRKDVEESTRQLLNKSSTSNTFPKFLLNGCNQFDVTQRSAIKCFIPALKSDALLDTDVDMNSDVSVRVHKTSSLILDNVPSQKVWNSPRVSCVRILKIEVINTPNLIFLQKVKVNRQDEQISIRMTPLDYRNTTILQSHFSKTPTFSNNYNSLNDLMISLVKIIFLFK